MTEKTSTENLLAKLEEKLMSVLSEVESQRVEMTNLHANIKALISENAQLKAERENFTAKLQDLVALLDAVNAIEPVRIESKPATMSMPHLEEMPA